MGVFSVGTAPTAPMSSSSFEAFDPFGPADHEDPFLDLEEDGMIEELIEEYIEEVVESDDNDGVHNDNDGSGGDHSDYDDDDDEEEDSDDDEDDHRKPSSYSRRSPGNSSRKESRTRSRSSSRSPASSQRSMLSSSSQDEGGPQAKSRKGRRPPSTGSLGAVSSHRRGSGNHRRSSSSHKGGRSSSSSGRGRRSRSSNDDTDHDPILRTPTSSSKRQSVGKTLSRSQNHRHHSSPSANSDTSSPSPGRSGKAERRKLKVSAPKNASKGKQDVGAKIFNIWDLRLRFQREFPNDQLPSDAVLNTLYSPEKTEAFERQERFKHEHPGEPVPSDEVLKRLYNVVPAAVALAPAPPLPPPAPPAPVSASKPLQPPKIVNPATRRDQLPRQDSGLTFATEGEWEVWKSNKKGFSDFGMDEFGNALMGMVGIMEGHDEENDDDDDDEGEEDYRPPTKFNGMSQSVRMTRSTDLTSEKKNNPSLETLRIGKHNNESRRSSSQSLGSYKSEGGSGVGSSHSRTKTNVKRNDSLARSMHGCRPTAPARSRSDDVNGFSTSMHHGQSFGTTNQKNTISPIDLLDIPSDHFHEKARVEDATDEILGRVSTLLIQTQGTTSKNGSSLSNAPPGKESNEFDPFQFRMQTDESNGEFQKSASSQLDMLGFGDDPFNEKKASVKKSGKKKKKDSGTGKKKAANSSPSERKTKRSVEMEKSARKTRTVPLGEESNENSRREYRNETDRSENIDSEKNRPKKTSSAGKAATTKKKKTKRTKSESSLPDGGDGNGFGPSFDFDTPPTFGFSSPTKQQQQQQQKAPHSEDVFDKAFGKTSKGEGDFFDVAESAWGHGGYTNAPSTPPIAPSRKERPRSEERRRAKTVTARELPFDDDNADDDDGEREEEDDFFDNNFITRTPPSGPPRATSAPHSAPSRGRRPGQTSKITSNGIGRGGWLSEMPGHMMQRPPSPPPPLEQDEDGFDLEVSGVDPISPLTVATRKMVRPMIGRRR